MTVPAPVSGFATVRAKAVADVPKVVVAFMLTACPPMPKQAPL
jgi:hypothetical protein